MARGRRGRREEPEQDGTVSGDPRRHTPEFRGSFVHLAEKHAASKTAKPKYQMMIVLDPDNGEQMDFLEALEEWIDEVAEKRWGDVPRKLKSPIKEGDDIGEEGPPPELEGMVVFNAANERRPGVIDAERSRIDDMDLAEECYSGAWYRASIKPYAWEHEEGGKGVSIELTNVMKVDDDEPFGAAAPDPEDDFAESKSGRRKARRGRRD